MNPRNEVADERLTGPCVVGRPINGITLNPLEFLLDEENPEHMKVFDTRDEAEAHLVEHGVPEDAMDSFRFLLFEGQDKDPQQDL